MFLKDIKTLGIIGGGISGLSFAHEVKKNWPFLPKVIVFDPRFGRRKPVRPNRTSGLIYRNLAEKYEMLRKGANVISQELHSITFHKGDKTVEIPDPLGREIYTVSKNPLPVGDERIESVYQFLQNQLGETTEIEFRDAYVMDMFFGPSGNEPFEIIYKQGDSGRVQSELVDAVVLTTRPASIEQTLRKKIKYIPPRTWPGVTIDLSMLGIKDRSKLQTLHKFLIGGGKVHTVDLIPHGETLTVTAIGKGTDVPVLYNLLRSEKWVNFYLPPDWEDRIIRDGLHTISVPVTAAKNLVSDGFAGLGGQVFGEILINGGLYNTLWAAKLLAEVIRDHGFARDDLYRHYYAQVRNRLRFQNLAARTIYNFTDNFILPSKRLACCFLQVMEVEKCFPPEKRYMSRYVWDLLVGERLFTRSVWGMIWNAPRFLKTMIKT